MKLLKKASNSGKFLNKQSKNDVEFLTKIKEFKFSKYTSNKDKVMFNRLVRNAENQLRSGTGLGVGLGSMKTLREYERRQEKIQGAENYIQKREQMLKSREYINIIIKINYETI